MKINMGKVDRILRLFAAAVLFSLIVNKYIKGTLAVALMVIAVIFVLTSLFSWCPIYSIFGVTTTDAKKKG